jgi:hypothetical protein
MPYEVHKIDVWSGDITDRPGGLAEVLAALAEAGADLSFVNARRRPDVAGTGIVFLTGIEGAAQIRAARRLGLAKNTGLAVLRVAGKNKPGTLARVAQALAKSGINLRGVSAAGVGTKFTSFLAFDTTQDRDKAARALAKA